MKKGAAVLAILPILLSGSVSLAAGPDAILGKWWNEKKDAQIEIYRCDSSVCGKIAYLKEPNYPANDEKGMAGLPKVDRENPEPAKKKNPIVGMNIISGFTYSGENLWENGTIYNPEDGKLYRCKLTLENSDRLKLRGFIGISLIGKTQYWTRVK